MKTEKNILIAFILNLAFSVFEFVGGIFTGSVAILSDAVHDIGDAFSIGFSYFMEKKSKKQPDNVYTYGYQRYSVIGSFISTVILIIGSVFVVYNAILRILQPKPIDYNGMIVFAVFGVIVNFIAVYFTKEGDSLNQKAVNLHMLEDVLGWIIVLIGAIIMRFTSFAFIDPILSIGVAVFIFIHAFEHLKEVLDLFLEKIPHGLTIDEVKKHLQKIEGVIDAHHIHIWSMDGTNHYATMHIVADGDHHTIKHKVRDSLKTYGICHTTLEIEEKNEHCHEQTCEIESQNGHHHHHHHHHHH